MKSDCFLEMPRKPLIRTKDLPYHVTARCNNKQPFANDLIEVWYVTSDELTKIIEQFECKIHAFVLMSNHFHLLISTPKDDLGVIMKAFMSSLTRRLNLLSGRSGRVFGSRYHWSLIDNEHYFDCALKYVYRNPVKARMCDSVESYPFSTIRNLLNQGANLIQIEPIKGHEQLVPEGDLMAFLNWMNHPFSNEVHSKIQKAFKKTRFEIPKEGWMRVRRLE